MTDKKSKLSEALSLIQRHAFYGDVTPDEARELLKSIDELDDVEYELREIDRADRQNHDPAREAELAADVGVEYYFENVQRRHRKFHHLNSYVIGEVHERLGDERLRLSLLWMDIETTTYQKSVMWRDPYERKTWRSEFFITEDEMEDALIDLEHFQDFVDTLVDSIASDEVIGDWIESFSYEDVQQDFDEEEVKKIVAEEVERQIDYRHFYDDDSCDQSIKKQAEYLRELESKGEQPPTTFMDDESLDNYNFDMIIELRDQVNSGEDDEVQQ